LQDTGIFAEQAHFELETDNSGVKTIPNLGVIEMNWLEKFLEETIAVNAYLFWQKYLRQEDRDKNSEEGSDR